MSLGLILTGTPLSLYKASLVNLLLNPGFESDFTFWNAYGGASIELSDPIMGSKSALIPPNGGMYQVVGEGWENATVLSFLAKTQTTGLVYVEFKDLSGNSLSRFDAYPNTSTTTAYTINNFAPPPVNAAQLVVGVYNAGSADLYVDEFLLR